MQNQKLCLKWNNHMSNMLSLLGSFQQKDMLVDVTISCQGQNIKAHKIILSACSPYFQNIFMENPCQHPIIIINGMKFEDITAILNFMYKGEVNVSHDGLSSFLQAAEALKVKGLAEVCGEKKGTNSISQEVQQSELNRPQRTETPPRKRPRNRKRSLSDSNRSDDEGLARKHREPSSPEVHELSGDESFTGDNSSNGPAFNTISRVPQNVYSRSHQSSSNMGGEDDDEYDVVESNKMLDTADSNVSMNNTNADNNLRIERIMGNATEIESSNMADPESPPDIKPIINFGESSAGPSESGSMMLYNEQSQPGPSSVQDSSLLHDNSHAQEDIKLNLPWPTNFRIPVERFSTELKQSIIYGIISNDQKEELMNHLALEIARYTKTPTQYQKDQVAIALNETFPHLIGSDIICMDGLSKVLSLIVDDQMQENKNIESNSWGVNVIQQTYENSSGLSLSEIRGLSNWSPPPLEGENSESMNVHKRWLKDEVKKFKPFQCVKAIQQKMMQCFSLRRKEINNGASLSYLKDEYPFLFSSEFLLMECELLTLKNFKTTFSSSATKVAHNLIQMTIMRIVDVKKNSKEIAYILLKFNSIPPESRRPDDEIVACLLILPYLFSASSSLVYEVYDKSKSLQFFIQKGTNYPHVVVRGDPFRSTLVYVVAEGKIMMECLGLIEAIVACMAIYYCCNIEYPVEAIDTYLFMQTQFFKLEHYGKLPQKIITIVEKMKKSVA